MNPPRPISTGVWCCQHLINFTLMPVTIISTVYATASRIYRLVRYTFFKPTYELSPENKARAAEIRIRFKSLNEARKKELPQDLEVQRNPPADGMAALVGEIAITVIKQRFPYSNEVLSGVSKEIASLISSFFEQVANNFEFKNLMNELLDYFISETEAHQKRSLTFYEEQKKKIEEALKDRNSEFPSVEARANKYLQKICKKGEAIFREKIYFEKYQQQKKLGKTEEEASESAKLYMDENQNLSKLIRDEDREEKFLSLYLNNCRESDFAEQKACSPHSKKVFASGEEAFANRIENLSSELSLKILEIFQPFMDEVLKIILNKQEINFKPINELIRPFLQVSLLEFLKSLTIPEQLENCLTKFVYPTLIEKIFSALTITIIKSNWNETSPLVIKVLIDQTPETMGQLKDYLRQKLTSSEIHYDQNDVEVLLDKAIQSLSLSSYIYTLLENTKDLDALANSLCVLISSSSEEEKIEAKAAFIKNLIKLIPLKKSEDENSGEELLINLLNPIVDQIVEKANTLNDNLWVELEDALSILKQLNSPAVEEVNTRFSSLALAFLELTDFAPKTTNVIKGNIPAYFLSFFSTKAAESVDVPALIDKIATEGTNLITSPGKVPHLIHEVLRSKFTTEEGFVDENKVQALFNGGSNPTISINLQRQFELLAKIVYDLSLRKGRWKFIIDQFLPQEEISIENLFFETQKTFFENKAVNLSRVEQIATIIFSHIEPTVQKVEKIEAKKIELREDEKGKEKDDK